MEAMTARQSWTDDRLDDFRRDVDRRFDAVDKRFDTVDRRFDQVHEEIKGLQAEMKRGFERVDERFERQQRLMVQVAVAMTTAFLAGFGGIAALIATQL